MDNDLKKLSGKTDGSLTLTEGAVLTGMITHDVLVSTGVTFVVRGMVCRDLVAEADSVVRIHGMVKGTVINKGATVEVFGMIGDIVDENASYASIIHPHAVVRGVKE